MKKGMTFEKAMDRLDTIVASLEAEQTPLEQSLELFSESTELIAYCDKQLKQAQLKIETLLPRQEPDKME